MVLIKTKIGTIRECESQIELQLSQFLTLISMDSGEVEQLELAKQFLFKTDSDTDKRLGLEYLYLNQCYQELQYVIDENQKSDNTLNHEAAILYQLMLDLHNGKQVHTIRTLSKAITSRHPEISCLRYFLYIEVDRKVYNYEKIGFYLNKIQKLLHQIDNPLFISFCQIRIKVILFHYYWKRNELILARKNAYEALQMPHHVRQKVHLHLNLALSYIFEDFDSSIYHIEEAKYIALQLGDQDILEKINMRTYPFICAHFGKVEGITTTDPIETAHIEIVKGNHQMAEVILDKQPVDTPFTQYYLGLATRKQHFFIYSYQCFMEKRSDHFFARLPLKASDGLGI
ncbi:AimR family lysis-lysogeny pheromone receptor [Gracilibacillus sp. S3-1-1]|uniref:AimR family lysis-lysogeny pheromone receptor n=1 Tax=Gracilibacillus pellucidus TaxID=3095368 RepID=A0ACC6M9P9_9BACI|nr:AimR family lysis-lysogeny pheromone receptor [Gracilibacillus sp. S3-1-1]MDX8047618.1 AimR family lysis-lysogeny pheromone receptor [Gracilibacillus sp. S3-1-1]